MSDNVDTQKSNLRPFTRRGRATDDPIVPDGTTVVSLWDPAVPEGLNEADDYWNDGQILILTGEMAEQQREVTDFVQATGTLTVAPRFVNPVATLLTVNSPAGDLVIDVADATGFTAGSLLTTDAPLGDLIIDVVDASIFRVGNAVIWENTPAAEMVVITNVDTILNQLTIAAPGIVLAAGYLVANGAVISMQSDAYIWDDAGAEAVTILGIAANQLTIAPPGIIAALGYNLVDNAAISRSPAILDDVEFTLMPPSTVMINQQAGVPIHVSSLIEERGAVFNTVVGAAADFFAADLIPTNTPTTFRIAFSCNAAGVLNVIRTEAGVPVTEHLNANAALVADCLYEFNVTVRAGQTINLQHSVGGTILSCIVVEIYG